MKPDILLNVGFLFWLNKMEFWRCIYSMWCVGLFRMGSSAEAVLLHDTL